MKAFEISSEIRARPELESAVRATQPTLEDVLGKSRGIVRAEWSLEPSDRPGRRALRLTLSDHTGSASGVFAEDELRQSRHLWDRFHHLWGDVLQDRFDKQMARLREPVLHADEE